MPIGVVVNCISVLLGGLIGSGLGHQIPPRLKKSLPTVFGFVAISMGIMRIPSSGNLSVVTLSVLLGAAIGEVIQIDSWLRRTASRMLSHTQGNMVSETEEASKFIVLAMVTFCASGTGIFGALEEGITGNASILLSKAGLDFFTAIIFASVAGKMIGFLSLPQAVLMLTLFFCGGLVSPLLSEASKAAFLSVGGIVTMMNGCAIAGISDIRPANAIPALGLVFVLSMFL